MGKHIEAKNTLKAMNEAYKKQIVLIKEECNLRIEVCMNYLYMKEHPKLKTNSGGAIKAPGEHGRVHRYDE